MSETELQRWPRVPLGQLATLIMGQAPPGADCNESGKGMPFVRAGEFGVERPTISQWTTRPLRTAKETDVLICVVGATSGKINLGADCAIGRSVAAIRPKNAILDPKYLYSFLKTRVIPLREASSGSAQGVIQRDLLEKEMIPLPSIQEQRRVVERLDSLLAKKSRSANCLTLVPPLLDRLRQSILAAAFRGDLTADWRARNPDVEPADKLVEKIRAERRRRWEETELARLTAKGKPPADDRWKGRYASASPPDMSHEKRRIPETWCWASVSDLTECLDNLREPINREERDRRTGSYPYFGANGQVGTIGSYIFDEPLILVTEDETFYGRTKPIAYRVDGKCWVNNHAHVLRVVPPFDLSFLHCALMHYPVEPWLSGTTGRAKLTQAALNRLPIAVPPGSEAMEISRCVRAAFERIDAIRQLLSSQLTELSRLDEVILAKAFRGELVPQDSTDEPASVLLERLNTEAAVAPTKVGRRARAIASYETPASPVVNASLARPKPVETSALVIASPGAPPAREPVPRASPIQQTLRLVASISNFLELPADAQTDHVHRTLLGEGPLEREDAVRRAAELLRDAGQASFQRLRSDGTLATCIDAALAVGLRQGRFDRPRPGTVRAVAGEVAQVPPALWRRALLASFASLTSPAADDDAAVRAAAAWSQAQFGLEFQRLRTGGHIDTALRAALAELLATGEVTRDRNGALTLRTRPD